MKFSIKNDTNDFNNFLSMQMQLMIPLNDFTTLLNLFADSIEKSIPVDLRFDTDNGLDVIRGTIIDVRFTIVSNDIDNTDMKLIFLPKDSNSLMCFQCDSVGSSTVEYNNTSVPGKFTKIYINNPKTKNVCIGFIFYGL